MATESNPGDDLSKGLEGLFDARSAASAPESTEDSASTTDKPPDRGQETAKGTDDKSAATTTAQADTTKTNASPSSSATTRPPRSEQRIQELIKERDEWRSKAEMTAKAPVAQVAEPAKTEASKEHVIVPPPDKPRYTMENLQNLKAKAKAEGNEELLEAIGEEMERVRMYDHDMKLWKLENGQAVERYQANQLHYRQHAVKNWPELAKADSPISVTYANMSQRFPELLNRPNGDGQYWLANVAHLVVAQKGHEAEKAALVEENKKLKEENDTYKRKMSPAKQTGESTVTGSDENEDDPGKVLTQKLRERFGR